jgi:hypothetical protein
MDNHYDAGVSWNENQEAFDKWAPEKSPTQQELQEEVTEVDEDNLVDDPEQLVAKVTGETTDDDLLTSSEGDQEVDELIAQTDIATETSTFEDELEAALAFPSEDKSESDSDIEPVANLDKPVEIMSPEESKEKTSKESPTEEKKAQINLPKKEEKKSEGLSTKTEPQKEKEEKDDFLDVEAHDGLKVPEGVLAQAAVIEKKMAELYGSVKPYQVKEESSNIFVTIDETHESFYIPVE